MPSNTTTDAASTARSLTDRAASGVAWALAGSTGQALLKVLVLMVLARLLSPENFGVAGGAAVVISFLGLFAQLGVAPALVQVPEMSRAHLVAGFQISVGLGLLAGVMVYLLAPQIEVLFRIEGLAGPLSIMALLLPVIGLQQVSEARIMRDLRFRFLAVEQVVSYGIGYGLVAVSLALAGFGVWALVGGVLVQGMVRTILMMLYRPPSLGLVAPRGAYQDLLRFGTGQALASIGRGGAYEVDNLIVARFLGAEALGFYGRAYQVVTMPTKLLGAALIKVLFPAMARVQFEPKRLERAYLRSMGVVFMLGLPFSALLALLAPEIVRVVLGPQWAAVVVPFQILAACVVFRVGHKISEALIKARGAVYRLAWTQWLHMALVAGGAYGGHFFGLPGVAAGVAAAVVVNFVIVFSLVSALSGVSLAALAGVFLRHLVLAGLVLPVAFVALSWLRYAAFHEAYRLVLIGGGVAAAYALVLVSRPSVLGEEGELVRSIAEKRLPAKFLRARMGRASA